MKKTTSFFSMLTMLLLFVGNNVWAESWVKTSPIDLLTGDVVAIVDLNKSVVMPNSNGRGTKRTGSIRRCSITPSPISVDMSKYASTA